MFPIQMVDILLRLRYSLILCKSNLSFPTVTETREADGRNRIKPGQLLVLAVYSYALVQGCKRDWISPSRLSKLGAAIVGVLSMGMSISAPSYIRANRSDGIAIVI